jgi:putative membrane protein
MNRTLVATATALWTVLLFQPVLAIAQTPQTPPTWDGPGPWHMMWGGGWGLGWIFPLFMFFMMLVGAFFMMRGSWGHGPHAGTDATSSALQILNERFAKGEIAKEEYEEKKAAIVRRA